MVGRRGDCSSPAPAQATSCTWFRRGAEQGRAECMFELGQACAGVSESARYWLGRAAAAGHDEAMNNFGVLLLNENPELAEYWLTKSAKAGCHAAQLNLQECSRR
ncbi:sel1 repeat family protein [Streptomyces phyllanthi]|uniref:Sel1 repeat family protein n=1 Tax=Streptomyces phyllanthi TaxID=1803180 RepID=A0A5N8VWN7_9ACTN|nr:sel1 repeat family protein [Streptomyces phyllanthi]